MDKAERDTLARAMRRNHGLITTAQAERAGISARELSRAHARGEVGRARHGTYRPPGMPVTWEDELAADIAACTRPAVVSHSAALKVHGFSVPGVRPQREIMVEGRARPTVAGDVEVHRTVDLPSADRMVIRRLPCTMVERTVIDMAARLSRALLLTLVDDVIMSGAGSRYVLHHRSEALWRGRKRQAARQRQVERRSPGRVHPPPLHLEGSDHPPRPHHGPGGSSPPTPMTRRQAAVRRWMDTA